VRTRDPKDGSEQIHKRRALVVAERRKVQGQQRPALVVEILRDRVGVERKGGLVPDEPRRIRGIDPKLKGDDRGDSAERDQPRGMYEKGLENAGMSGQLAADPTAVTADVRLDHRRGWT